jgi:hypothetical protein
LVERLQSLDGILSVTRLDENPVGESALVVTPVTVNKN